MIKMQLVGAFFALSVLAGCQIFGPDSSDVSTSTYPEAMDLPAADFGAIMGGTHDAGQFNLTVFVVGISECPEDAVCIIADHISVAESPFTDGIPMMIDATKPSQFTQDAQYVLSVEIASDAFPETQQPQYVRLLAYSPVSE